MSIDIKVKGPPLNFVQWTVCVIAAIGFAFDTYELLMAPLIMRPAMESFGVSPERREFWFGIFLYVPTLMGGIFGLLGGYLTDLWGRRRVLVLSILLYAGSAFAAGFASSIEMLRSCAAQRSLACASSSWRQWRGWPNCFPIRVSANRCSGSHRRLHRSAG
jgi:MFS family permease